MVFVLLQVTCCVPSIYIVYLYIAYVYLLYGEVHPWL